MKHWSELLNSLEEKLKNLFPAKKSLKRCAKPSKTVTSNNNFVLYPK